MTTAARHLPQAQLAGQSAGRSPARPVEAMRLERDRHVAFAFAAADLLIEAGIDGRIVAASGAAQAVLGLAVDALPDKSVLDIVAPPDRRLVHRLLEQIRRLGRIDPSVLRMARAEDASVRVLFGGCRLPNPVDRVFLSVTVLPATLTAKEPPRDVATGLLTREALQDAAGRTGADGFGTRQLQLLHLDGLSGAARQLPPDRAAMLMEEIGAALRAPSVGGDSAGRLAEDAFGIVTKAGDDQGRDAALVADISEAIRAAGVSDGRIGPRMARIDLSQSGLSDGDAGLALTYAMNNFVASQGNGFTIHSLQDGLSAAVKATVSRFAETRRIIAAGEFALVYQPVVALSGRAVHHHEALSRFPGNANTFETIVFSEDLGLVAELDLAVCRRAIEALDQNPGVALAVNLSGRSVQNEAFRAALGSLVKPLIGLRRRLLFELTESAAVDNLEDASSYLRWLRGLGHAVCLDEFGAGAAAYSYLRRFDVDFVKIDGPFLQAAANGPRERALIRSICVLCKDIGSQVIGEMIEDEAAASLAATLGIDYGQGWLFGKPVEQIPSPIPPRSTIVRRRAGEVETWQ